MNELDPHREDVPGEARGHGRRHDLPAAATPSRSASSGRSDPYDRILDGRSATVERIYLDYDDKLYFGVTVDDDPGSS